MIAFRLDANSHVATGHMHRCISIAKQCLKMGQQCVFFVAKGSETTLLAENHITYKILDLRWDDWDYGIPALMEQCARYRIQCLVVDSYLVTPGFFEEMTAAVPTFYLDDLCKKIYNVSAVLHYSEWPGEHILADLYRGTGTETYSGMQYMPLKEEFSKVHRREKAEYDLLITTGGSDPFHVTKRLLKMICNSGKFQGLNICVVLGKMNPDQAEILELYGEKKYITVLQNISNMHEIMQNSRFAVTAGGTTVYELMASGTLFVCFSFSEDQTIFAQKLADHEHAGFAGDVREDIDLVLLKLCEQIEADRKMNLAKRQKLVQKNMLCVDGQGSERIAALLMRLCEKTGI